MHKTILAESEKRKAKLLRVFTQVINFVVVLISSVSELVVLYNDLVLCFQDKNEDSFGKMSFVLCFGTLISLYINEQIYEPTSQIHKVTHLSLSISLLIGVVLSFIGMIIPSQIEDTIKWVLLILRIIVILCFWVSTVAYFIKIYNLWSDDQDFDSQEIVPFEKLIKEEQFTRAMFEDIYI